MLGLCLDELTWAEVWIADAGFQNTVNA
jgi:hypothetical protein